MKLCEIPWEAGAAAAAKTDEDSEATAVGLTLHVGFCATVDDVIRYAIATP